MPGYYCHAAANSSFRLPNETWHCFYSKENRKQRCSAAELNLMSRYQYQNRFVARHKDKTQDQHKSCSTQCIPLFPTISNWHKHKVFNFHSMEILSKVDRATDPPDSPWRWWTVRCKEVQACWSIGISAATKCMKRLKLVRTGTLLRLVTSKEGETRWKNMTEQTIINKPFKEDLRSGAKRRQIHNIPESPLFFPFHTGWNASQKEHLLRCLASVCNSSELHPLHKLSFICTAQVKEINTIGRIEVYCKSKTQHVGIRQTQQKK